MFRDLNLKIKNLFHEKTIHRLHYVELENKVLYIGVTGNLPRRIFEHKEKRIKGFTQKYNCTKLVYYEFTDDVHEALEYEKRLKNWHKDWKENLIRKENPDWKDLSSDFLDQEFWG